MAASDMNASDLARLFASVQVGWVGTTCHRVAIPAIFKSWPASLRNALQDKDLRVSAESPSAPFQRAVQEALPSADMPPDLAQIAAAWQRLPEAVKAGILTIVTASHGQ